MIWSGFALHSRRVRREERRNIALMALAIWALVGGAIGYGWFKRVPWDDL